MNLITTFDPNFPTTGFRPSPALATMHQEIREQKKRIRLTKAQFIEAQLQILGSVATILTELRSVLEDGVYLPDATNVEMAHRWLAAADLLSDQCNGEFFCGKLADAATELAEEVLSCLDSTSGIVEEGIDDVFADEETDETQSVDWDDETPALDDFDSGEDF